MNEIRRSLRRRLWLGGDPTAPFLPLLLEVSQSLSHLFRVARKVIGQAALDIGLLSRKFADQRSRLVNVTAVLMS